MCPTVAQSGFPTFTKKPFWDVFLTRKRRELIVTFAEAKFRTELCFSG